MTIGETIADPNRSEAAPGDDRRRTSLSVTIGINTARSPAPKGSRLTASQIRDRLDSELVGNVSLRVRPTSRPGRLGGTGSRRAPARDPRRADAPGRLRADGRQTGGADEASSTGRRCEPVERVAIDVPEEYVGVITQLLALRKGRLQQMVNHGSGWARIEYLVPARGLIGFRSEFLTETRGTGILHHVFESWEPWHGELRTRPTGSLVADRRGEATVLRDPQPAGAWLALHLARRQLYEGMIVGENAREDDLDVNASKPKKLTNMRAASADELVRLIPPRPLSLEQALEFIRDDEAVEVTPRSIRLRKVELSASKRQTLASRAKRERASFAAQPSS